MFDSKKNSKKSSKRKSGNSPSVNMLSEGAKVKGEIHVKDDIRIAGVLEGDLHTKGKAILNSSGKVEGNIRGVYADVAGTIEGEIRVSDKVVIRESAVIRGNVYTKTLQVEEGAQFDGTLSMSDETADKIFSADGQLENDSPDKSADGDQEVAADAKKKS
jgi:cytoskeletal protein CcmA (bactofilin family)